MKGGILKGELLHYGLVKGELAAAVVDVFSVCYACFLMVCRCLYYVALLWHNTLSNLSWVLTTWDMIVPFLVSTMTNLMSMSLPVL